MRDTPKKCNVCLFAVLNDSSGTLTCKKGLKPVSSINVEVSSPPNTVWDWIKPNCKYYIFSNKRWKKIPYGLTATQWRYLRTKVVTVKQKIRYAKRHKIPLEALGITSDMYINNGTAIDPTIINKIVPYQPEEIYANELAYIRK